MAFASSVAMSFFAAFGAALADVPCGPGAGDVLRHMVPASISSASRNAQTGPGSWTPDIGYSGNIGVRSVGIVSYPAKINRSSPRQCRRLSQREDQVI